MIIIRLSGGLGNQIFQYACGRALSLRNNDTLKLDTTGYLIKNNNPFIKSDTARSYSLGYFAINESIASPEEIARLKYPHGIFSKASRLIQTKIFRQFNIGFIPRLLSRKGDLYLYGYWQSPLYFQDAEMALRKDLTLKKPLGTAASFIFQKIKDDPTAVSLHVRRGDYASDVTITESRGLCSQDYYTRAIAYLAEKIENIHLYVFSDDITWVQKNMKFPYPATFVSTPLQLAQKSNAAIPDYEELILMSTCRHHIIANSSFSWWGAWLNPRHDKIVIAPKRWVAKGEHHHKDTVPPSWIRL